MTLLLSFFTLSKSRVDWLRDQCCCAIAAGLPPLVPVEIPCCTVAPRGQDPARAWVFLVAAVAVVVVLVALVEPGCGPRLAGADWINPIDQTWTQTVASKHRAC